MNPCRVRGGFVEEECTPERMQEIKKLLWEIYKEYSLDKMTKIDRLLEKYKGREEEFLRFVRHKYGLDIAVNSIQSLNTAALYTAVLAPRSVPASVHTDSNPGSESSPEDLFGTCTSGSDTSDGSRSMSGAGTFGDVIDDTVASLLYTSEVQTTSNSTSNSISSIPQVHSPGLDLDLGYTSHSNDGDGDQDRDEDGDGSKDGERDRDRDRDGDGDGDGNHNVSDDIPLKSDACRTTPKILDSPTMTVDGNKDSFDESGSGSQIGRKSRSEIITCPAASRSPLALPIGTYDQELLCSSGPQTHTTVGSLLHCLCNVMP